MKKQAIDRRYFLTGAALGIVSLALGYYLLWVKGNTLGWVFLILAFANYKRVQSKVRAL